ncbi:MAG: DUF5009 domain-containing protein, partial [Flavobacteriaceae bacterium]
MGDSKRIASIDILRGFDMLMIIFADRFFASLHKGADTTFTRFLAKQFDHPDWFGSTFYDLIMPLFLFVVGAVIPFSIGKKIEQEVNSSTLYRKLVKRFLILFVLGWIVQGNLLALDSTEFNIFNNTLQAIAVGYFFSVLSYIHLTKRWRYIAFVACLVTYIGFLTLPYLPEIGRSRLLPDENYAIYFDRLILGRFQQYGSQYSWLLTGLGFTATTLSGVFAGELIKSKLPRKKVAMWLLVYGIAGILLGLIVAQFHPIVKKIWTSSFVLASSGVCFLLMASFYWIIDIKGKDKWTFPLKVIGMNAITAYVLSHVFNFSEISNYILFGIAQYSGDYHEMISSIGGFGILY